MSNYYTYVNHTLRERVDLNPWIGLISPIEVQCRPSGGGTMQEAHAILFGGVLAYLLFSDVRRTLASGEEFRGRWGTRRDAWGRVAQVVVVDWENYCSEHDDVMGYIDIATDLVAEMRRFGLWRLVERGAECHPTHSGESPG